MAEPAGGGNPGEELEGSLPVVGVAREGLEDCGLVEAGRVGRGFGVVEWVEVRNGVGW